MVGTPAYMAPEQAAFRPASPASDWYAVGVILFEALTRRMPFEGPTSDLLLAKQRPLAAPPSALVEEVPPDLERLCVDLLQVDPDARPRGEEVLRRLEGEAASTGRGRGDPAHGPFVGRREQLDALHAAFDASLTRGRAGRRDAARPLGHGKERPGRALPRRPGRAPRRARPLRALLRARGRPLQGRRPGRR